MGGLSGITAVILAGGLGTRLREAVADRPKVLAEVNGRPFLTYLLDRLAAYRISRVVLCTGYMAEQIHAAVGCNYRTMELVYSREVVPLGTGGAIRLAMPLTGSDPILVMNGDSYCDADFELFAHHHHAKSAQASLVLVNVADVTRYGAVNLEPSGVITGFCEKGGMQGEGMINAGIYLFNRSVVAAIPEGKQVSLEREVFPALIGHGLYGFSQRACFIDIGIPSDYYAASSILKSAGKE